MSEASQLASEKDASSISTCVRVFDKKGVDCFVAVSWFDKHRRAARSSLIWPVDWASIVFLAAAEIRMQCNLSTNKEPADWLAGWRCCNTENATRMAREDKDLDLMGKQPAAVAPVLSACW